MILTNRKVTKKDKRYTFFRTVKFYCKYAGHFLQTRPFFVLNGDTGEKNSAKVVCKIKIFVALIQLFIQSPSFYLFHLVVSF